MNSDFEKQLENIDVDICYPIYAVGRDTMRRYISVLDDLGIVYPQYMILTTLVRRGDVNIKLLCTILAVDAGTISPMLKKMEALGYITRTRDKRDERSVIVSITEEGRNVKNKCTEMRARMVSALRLTEEEYEETVRVLKRLNDRLI